MVQFDEPPVNHQIHQGFPLSKIHTIQYVQMFEGHNGRLTNTKIKGAVCHYCSSGQSCLSWLHNNTNHINSHNKTGC